MELWPYLRCPNLLVFAGDQHRCHANELELRPRHGLQGQVPVYNVYCEVERFWHEVESLVRLDEPFREHGAHFVGDRGLIAHVVNGTALMLQNTNMVCMVKTDSEQAACLRTDLLKMNPQLPGQSCRMCRCPQRNPPEQTGCRHPTCQYPQ